MSDSERTTETIVEGILSAMKQDPYEMERFIRRTLADVLPLIVTEDIPGDDAYEFVADVSDNVKSWYEPDDDDAELIAEEHDIEYEDIDDQYKRDENEPLDVWLKIHDGEEEAEYEANTFRDYYGNYRIEWSHVDIGWVTTETFGTYEETVSWYEENGYQDFIAF